MVKPMREQFAELIRNRAYDSSDDVITNTEYREHLGKTIRLFDELLISGLSIQQQALLQKFETETSLEMALQIEIVYKQGLMDGMQLTKIFNGWTDTSENIAVFTSFISDNKRTEDLSKGH